MENSRLAKKILKNIYPIVIDVLDPTKIEKNWILIYTEKPYAPNSTPMSKLWLVSLQKLIKINIQ